MSASVADADDDDLYPLISYHSLRRAMRVIDEFVLYYFPLHGLDEKDFFRAAPMLLFAEATAYQTDEEFERQIESSLTLAQRIALVQRILERQGLYDGELEQELQRGLRLWKFERALVEGASFSAEDIVEVMRLKCADYRYQHRLLFKVLGKAYDDELLELSWLVEQIGEIEDDLLQYEQDLGLGVLNCYDLYVRLYAEQAPRHLQAHLDSLQQQLERHEAALQATRPELAEVWLALQQAYVERHPTPPIPTPIMQPPVAQKSGSGDARVNPCELRPEISYKALMRALVIVEEIITYYFPLHGLGVEEALRWLPELIYAEAMLYQIDEEYERHTDDPHFVSPHLDRLREVLAGRGLFDEALEAELQGGIELWRLEQRMCSGGAFGEAEVEAAMHYRCGDYRFLHRLLFRLQEQPYDEALIALCSGVEERGEIEDDLRSYAKDVAGNVYNSYRMLVMLHAEGAPARLQSHLARIDARIRRQSLAMMITRPRLVRIGVALQREYANKVAPPEIPTPIIEG